MPSKSLISRRSFIGGGAVLTGAGMLGLMSGCAPKSHEGTSSSTSQPAGSLKSDWLGDAPTITDDQCSETLEFDVVVVGAGTSGYFAAASSAEHGSKTLLIEKAPTGNSIRSSALGAVGTRLQKEQNADISITDIVTDMDHYALGQIDSSLIRLWAENSGEAIDWYTDLLSQNNMEVQLEWNMPSDTTYHEWPTGHGTNGEYPSREGDVAKIFDSYITSFEGCEERFNTSLQALIVENNRVVGLYAKTSDDAYIRINASKGVIIATGGYAFNPEMYQALQPTRFSTLGTFDAFPSCTGDGIKSLLRIGAMMDENHTSLTFNRCLLTKDQNVGNPYDTGSSYGYYFFSSQPFLRVNYQGKRFHNESAPYDFVLNAISKNPAEYRYWHQVWDANWKENVFRFHTTGCSTICFREGADHDAYPEMMDDWIEPEMQDFIDAGYIVTADTLEGLADQLFDDDTAKENFLKTCKRQNELFDNQSDIDFGKEPFRLSELRTPPFYASVKSCGLTLCTLDGIVVNTQMQPVKEDGSIIEGVYVVGNDQGGFYSGTYPNLAVGLNAGRCATFGRMVGKALGN